MEKPVTATRDRQREERARAFISCSSRRAGSRGCEAAGGELESGPRNRINSKLWGSMAASSASVLGAGTLSSVTPRARSLTKPVMGISSTRPSPPAKISGGTCRTGTWIELPRGARGRNSGEGIGRASTNSVSVGRSAGSVSPRGQDQRRLGDAVGGERKGATRPKGTLRREWASEAGSCTSKTVRQAGAPPIWSVPSGREGTGS